MLDNIKHTSGGSGGGTGRGCQWGRNRERGASGGGDSGEEQGEGSDGSDLKSFLILDKRISSSWKEFARAQSSLFQTKERQLPAVLRSKCPGGQQCIGIWGNCSARLTACRDSDVYMDQGEKPTDKSSSIFPVSKRSLTKVEPEEHMSSHLFYWFLFSI